MTEEQKITRRRFLALIGAGVGSFALSRIIGLKESVTSVAFMKNVGRDGYGNSIYGGSKKG